MSVLESSNELDPGIVNEFALGQGSSIVGKKIDTRNVSELQSGE